MSKVNIRKATQADYEGVIGIIPNLYDGTDYLPGCYHNMLKDERRFPVLAEVQGEIIGFEMHYVVDEGQVVIMQAGRIKEKYRGMGLSKNMMQYGLSNVYQKYPMVKFLTFTSKNDDEVFKLMQHQPVQKFFYRILRRIISYDSNFLYNVTCSPGFENLCKTLPMNETKLLTPSDAVQALDSLIGATKILFDHAWLVNHEPFRPLHANHVTITHSSTKGTATVLVSLNEHGSIVSLSFGTVTLIRRVALFRIDFYCHRSILGDETGKMILAAHISKHIIFFSQLKRPFHRVVLEVFIPKEQNPDDVSEYFNQLGTADYEVVEKRIRVSCVERKTESVMSYI